MACTANANRGKLAALKCGLSTTAGQAAYLAGRNPGVLLLGAGAGIAAGLEKFQRLSYAYRQQLAQTTAYTTGLNHVSRWAVQAAATSDPTLRRRMMAIARRRLDHLKQSDYDGLAAGLKQQFRQQQRQVESWLNQLAAAENEGDLTRAFVRGAAVAGDCGMKSFAPRLAPPSLHPAIRAGLLGGAAGLLAGTAVVALYAARRRPDRQQPALESSRPETPTAAAADQPERRLARIELQPVRHSSLVSAAGYDPAGQTLGLTFKSGGQTYLYDGVPAAIGQGFLAADHKGRFFHQHIRGQYPSTRLGPQA